MAEKKPDFQVYTRFCDLVTEAMLMESDVKSRHNYITKHIENNDLKDAYNVIYQIAPDMRYHAFKSAIDEETGRNWECAGLKKYFAQFIEDSDK